MYGIERAAIFESARWTACLNIYQTLYPHYADIFATGFKQVDLFLIKSKIPLETKT